MKTAIRVQLVDDQGLFRHALAALIDAQPDMVLAGQACNGLQGLELARTLAPDVVLMDVEMPVMGGLEAAQAIKMDRPETKIIMLTVSDDEEDLLTAVRQGVDGYLLKEMHPAQLFEMVRLVMQDQTPVSPSLVSRLVTELRTLGKPARQVAPETEEPALSQREIAVLRCVSQGLTNKEIAKKLSISDGTVKNHVHNALHKLHMENRVQAASYVVRHGLSVAPEAEV